MKTIVLLNSGEFFISLKLTAGLPDTNAKGNLSNVPLPGSPEPSKPQPGPPPGPQPGEDENDPE